MSGIDVVLTGLMLICFDGQPNCPDGNRAWIVKAKPDGNEPCELKSGTTTTLEILFDSDGFGYTNNTDWFDCSKDKTTLPGNTQVTCKFVKSTGAVQDSLCVDLDYYTAPKHQRLDSNLKSLPRLDEVDRRFKAVIPERLTNPYYVPTVLRFPAGAITAGLPWPLSDKPKLKPTLWMRSDGSAGGALPRELSDRVKVSYEGADQSPNDYLLRRQASDPANSGQFGGHRYGYNPQRGGCAG